MVVDPLQVPQIRQRVVPSIIIILISWEVKSYNPYVSTRAYTVQNVGMFPFSHLLGARKPM